MAKAKVACAPGIREFHVPDMARRANRNALTKRERLALKGLIAEANDRKAREQALFRMSREEVWSIVSRAWQARRLYPYPWLCITSGAKLASISLTPAALSRRR